MINTKFVFEEIDVGSWLNDFFSIDFYSEEFHYPFTKSGEFLEEPKATPDMIKHLIKNLDLDKTHYKIVDVHNKPGFLETPAFDFFPERKGTPDALIVQKDVPEKECAKCFCVGFEFKTPATIDTSHNQLLFEIIGSWNIRKNSKLPFLFVKTDLQTFTFYYLRCTNKIVNFTTKEPTSAMQIIKNFLNN